MEHISDIEAQRSVADSDPSELVRQLQPGDLLTPKEASATISVDERTLANWRSAKKGPPWVRVGDRMVRYPRNELAAFVAKGAGA